MPAQRLPVRLTRLRLPGRTVRVRLTVLYGILFFVSGAVLLAIASGVAVARSASVQAVPAAGQATRGSALAQAQARIRMLQAQLQNLQSQTPSAPGRFVANASHELRTPLTTMRAALDVALAKPEPAPPQTVALAGRLRTELDRIERLLEAFLVLARAQHRSMPGRAVLPLDYIVGSALADQAAAITAMDLTVQDTSSQGGAWVAGSQALLSRMVENVIDNAVCHNTPGGWIAVTTSARGAGVRLLVENGGQVLDQQQVAELSQPFRRLEADRIGTDKGSGLGLSIVAAIAEAHGGSLDLRARPGGGLRVCVDLPAAAAATSAAVPAGARA